MNKLFQTCTKELQNANKRDEQEGREHLRNKPSAYLLIMSLSL